MIPQQDPGLPNPDQQKRLPTLADVPIPENKPIEYTPAAPVTPPKAEAPEQEDYSPLGFAKNLGENMADVVKGLGQMAWYIPDKLIRGGSEWVSYLRGQRGSIGEDFSGPAMDVIKQGMHENMKAIIKGTVESYKEYQHPLLKAYNRPLDVFLDALTVADLGSSAAGTYATRAAKAAERAGNASEAARWTEVASKAEKGAIGAFMRPMSESPTLALARKVPFIDKTLTALKLTPESAATSKLLRELQSWHDAGMSQDMHGIVQALAGVPEVDIETTLRDVARGSASKETLAHPASAAAYEWFKKWSEQITNDKVDRNGLSEAAARNAPLMMVRNDLTKIAFGKLRNNGAISDTEMKALNIILNSGHHDEVANVIDKLQKRGVFTRILGTGEEAEITSAAKPGAWLRDRFAPQEIPTLNVPGTEIRRSILRSIREKVETGERAQEVLDAYAKRVHKLPYAVPPDNAYSELPRVHAVLLDEADRLASAIHQHIATGPAIYGEHPFGEYYNTHAADRLIDEAWGNHVRSIGEDLESIVYNTHIYEWDEASHGVKTLRGNYRRLTEKHWPLTNPEAAGKLEDAQRRLGEILDELAKPRYSDEQIRYYKSKSESLDKAWREARDYNAAPKPILGGRMTEAYRKRLQQLVDQGEFAKKDYLQNWQKLSEQQVFDTVQQHLADTGKDPAYYHMIHQQHLDAASPLLPNALRGGKQAWMKARTGATGEIGDMRVILPIMSKQWRDFQKVNEFFRRFKELPFVNDVTDAIREGTYKQPEGRVIFSHEATSNIFYKDQAEQQARLEKNLKRYAGPNGELNSDTWRQAIVNGVNPNVSADLAKRLQQAQGMRIYDIPKDVGDLLSKSLSQSHPLTRFIFDKPIDLLRVFGLYMNPFWYAHTTVGHSIVNLLSGMNPFSYSRAGAKNFAKLIPDEIKTAVEAGLNVGFTQAERKASGLSSLPPFRNLGEFSHGIENFFRSASFMDNLTKEAVKRKLLTTGEAMFAANEVIEQKLRPLFEEAAIRGEKRGTVLGIDQASALQAAIDKTNSWLGNYNAMHPLERDVLRRVIPFWSFVKNMNLLALRLPIDRPMLSRFFGQVGELHREEIAHTMVNAMDDEHLPDYLEGHVPVGYDTAGNTVFVSIKGLNPFNNYGALYDPKKLITHANPIIKATIEYFGGRDMWSKKDLKSNEPIFDYSGRAYKVRIENGKTTLVRDVPGESWIAQFAGQYPQVKVLRQIVDGYHTDEKGVPVTQPFMDSNGNWQYPTTWLDSALKMAGISIKRVKEDSLDNRETMLKIAMIKGMEKHLKDAPPEFRSFIIDSIKRAGRGQFQAEGY